MLAEPGERFPWFDAPFWEEVGERARRAAEEEGEAVARASVYFAMFTHQLVTALTPFRFADPRAPDQWLSLRPGVEAAAIAVEASAPLVALGYGDQVERNRMLVDHAARFVEDRAAGASKEAHNAAARWKELLVRRGPEQVWPTPPRRDAPRPSWGDRSKQLGHATHRRRLDFHLQRPAVDRFRGIQDAATPELVGAWVEDLERNYAELVASIPPDCLEHAELDFEAHAPHEEQPSPVEVRVEDRRNGDLADTEPLATSSLVIDGHLSPQPDGIAPQPGDRWRIRGHRLRDGTIMPCWGTHRTVDSARRRG